MELQKYKLSEHLYELKYRLALVVFCFISSFIVSYIYRQEIFSLLLSPLVNLAGDSVKKIIYTGLAEAFFSYITLSAFTALLATLPLIAIQIYLFIRPGLYKRERMISAALLTCSPILFFSGTILVFYFVMPKAWEFFLSFQETNLQIPLLLEARISEYLTLVIKLILAFGIAFQMPILLVLLSILGIITPDYLIKKRRIAIVLNFIIAGIITPPDIASQIFLAIPMLLLYELSILACKFVAHK